MGPTVGGRRSWGKIAKLMRWFIWSGIALALLWIAYVASPYWALWRFEAALAVGDPARIVERVNMRALRVSLAKAIVSAGLANRKAASAIAGSDTASPASAIAIAAEPLLEQLVTPVGLMPLLRDMAPARADTEVRSRGFSAFGIARDVVNASRWRGFRNVYFTIPARAETGTQVRLQFRLSRLQWRLVSIDLPPEARANLIERVVREHEEARR